MRQRKWFLMVVFVLENIFQRCGNVANSLFRLKTSFILLTFFLATIIGLRLMAYEAAIVSEKHTLASAASSKKDIKLQNSANNKKKAELVLPPNNKLSKESFCVPLMENGAVSAVIVTPKSEVGDAWAEKLNEAIVSNGGVELPVVAPGDIIDPATWLVKSEFRGKNLVLIGNTANNPALWEFYLHFYVGACPDYPAADEFIVRTIFEPFVRDRHALFIGGRDEAAIDRAVLWVVDSMPKWQKDKNIQVPALIAGLKPRGRFKKVGSSYWGYLGRTAHRFQWDGDLTAISQAVREFRALDPKQRGADFGNRHYAAWPRFFGLRWLLSAGGFNREEIEELRKEFPKDWLNSLETSYGVSCRWQYSNRHALTDVTAKWMIGKWILEHCNPNEEDRAAIAKIVAIREERIIKWCQGLYLTGDHHPDPFASRAQLSPHVALIAAWLGDRRFLDSTAAKMAAYHLEGFYRYQDSLFDFPAGIAAQLGRNPEMTWLVRHLNSGKFRPQLVFGPLNAGWWFLDSELKEEFPKDFLGLYIQGSNPRVFNLYSKKALCGMKPNELPVEQCFDYAVFRGDFEGKKEYLSLFGLNRQIKFQPLYMNSIFQYADMGEIFLQDSKKVSNMLNGNLIRRGAKRSDRMQVSVSAIDEEKPVPYAELRCQARFPEFAALTSRDPSCDGVAWDRSVFWRPGRYFTVFDRLQAKKTGNYNFTCQWRSPHPAALNGRRWEGQVRGKSFTVLGAREYEAKAGLESHSVPRCHGLRQFHKRQKLKAGELVTFGNLLFCHSAEVNRRFNICQLSKNLLLVKGTSEAGPEIALYGVDIKGELIPGVLSAEAGLVAVCPDAVYFGGLKSYQFFQKQEDFDQVCQLRLELSGENQRKIRLELEKLWKNHAVDPFEDLPGIEPVQTIKDMIQDQHEVRDFKILSQKLALQKKALDMVIDLGREVSLTKVSLGMRANRDRPYSYAPGELKFAVATDPNHQFADKWDEEPNRVEDQFFFFRLPGLNQLSKYYRSYNYGGNMPCYRLPIDRKTRFLKIRAYQTEKGKKPIPPRGFAHVFITAQGCPKEYLVRLNSGDLDGDGADELIALGGRNQLVVFDALGNKLWNDRPGVARDIDATAKQILADHTKLPDPPEELERFRPAGEIEVEDWVTVAKPVDLRNQDEIKAKPLAPKSLLLAGTGEWLKLYRPDGSKIWFTDYLAAANEHEHESVRIRHRDSLRLPMAAEVVYPQALKGEPRLWVASWTNYTYVFNRSGALLEDLRADWLFVSQPVVDQDLTGDGVVDIARFSPYSLAIGNGVYNQQEHFSLNQSDQSLGPVLVYAFRQLPPGGRHCAFVTSYEAGLLDIPTFKETKRVWQKDFKQENTCAEFVWSEQPAIIIGKRNGLILKLDLKSGKRLSLLNLGEPVLDLAVVERNGETFFFCLTPNHLYKLDVALEPVARLRQAHPSRIWLRPLSLEKVNYLRKLRNKDGSDSIAVAGKDGVIRIYKP